MNPARNQDTFEVAFNGEVITIVGNLRTQEKARRLIACIETWMPLLLAARDSGDAQEQSQ